ncbi:hypothetical protein MJA45_02005 [Paenibacillus aurantius]|uniref:Uncharacterized protein n=1 Tax=Paenibacillus aurantius TaxID=2918900 RepID=A0AA96LI05_9BACL|nr:hypothetical protein [Paenibacillus aurantius]WNQ11852.1 hypothetical protein MJA45_02005 [Paenibacillus aurantius]
MWKSAARLARMEIRRKACEFLFSGAVTVFYTILMTNLLQDVSEDASNGVLVDVLFLLLSMIQGMTMNISHAGYWKTRPYTAKLKWMKSLPVTDREITGSRFLVLGVTLLWNLLVFYISLLFLSRAPEGGLTGGYGLAFVALWLWAPLLIGACCAYFELVMKEKNYLILISVLTVVIITVPVLLGKGGDPTLVALSYRLLDAYGGGVVLAALAAAAVGTYAFYRSSIIGLGKRDLR